MAAPPVVRVPARERHDGADHVVPLRRDVSLDDRYLLERGRIYLTGVQAIVRLALDQHRADRRRGLHVGTLISGYQGSPLGGLDIELQRRRELLDEHHVVHVPGLNEELGDGTVTRVKVKGPQNAPRPSGGLRVTGSRGPRDTYG